MRKVLIITYYWPPSGGSGVQRWVKFAKYLPSNGWQPIICTPENPDAPSKDESLLADIPEEAVVIKRHIPDVYAPYRKLTGTKVQAGEVNPINHQQKSWLQKLALKVRGNCFIPDPKVLWIRPSVKFLTQWLKENPVDIIITTGPPHSMHLIGQKVASLTGIPWIADFRDPWTKIFYFKHLALSGWAERKHRKLEKSVLDEAAAVIAVSPLVQEEFKSMTRNRIELITNGFDEDDFRKSVDSGAGQASAHSHFTMTHTGLFAADGNPEIIWKALADKALADKEFARALDIRLVGKTDTAIIASIREAGLGHNLQDLGYQDHTVAVREQQSASILILPLRKEPEYRATLPGKLFEYLASRRPVLGVGQTDGAMARILTETQAGEVYGWHDLEGVKGFIDEAWKVFKSVNTEMSGSEATGTTEISDGTSAMANSGSTSSKEDSEKASDAGKSARTSRFGHGDIGRFERKSLTIKLVALMEEICGAKAASGSSGEAPHAKAEDFPSA